MFVTARIRRMEQGNVFSLFTPGVGGTPVRFPLPSPVPCPFLGAKGTQSWPGGYPSLWFHVPSWGGTPILAGEVPQSWLGGGVPQSWPRGLPQDRGTPKGRGSPSQDRGTPGQDWAPPPPARTGVPPNRLRCGRYASCGFTQEDFLV